MPDDDIDRILKEAEAAYAKAEAGGKVRVLSRRGVVTHSQPTLDEQQLNTDARTSGALTKRLGAVWNPLKGAYETA